MDTDCRFRLLTGGRQVTAPSNAKQDNFTRRANYTRPHCHLKTNRPIFGFVGLQSFRGTSESLQLWIWVLRSNSTGCNESKSRGILSIRKLFRREPLQLSCLRIWWRQVRETFLMLGPTICNDIWTSLISWKSDRCRRSFEISPIQVSVSWYRK